MPFISKDWRSPGEEWVKTDEGWEKKKILECTSRTPRTSTGSEDDCCEMISQPWCYEDKENVVPENQMGRAPVGTPPHCYMVLKSTREIAGFNGLSDALKRLDFRSAVEDSRKFGYVCKLLDLLLQDRLTSLSGCAQKVLFNVLEQVALQVSTSGRNPDLLRKLLLQLRSVEEEVWGQAVGSTTLRNTHLATIQRITTMAGCVQLTQPESVPSFVELPEECVREVMLRLTNHKDLDACGAASHVMATICDESRLWRELCSYHFTSAQVEAALNSAPPNHPPSWYSLYHKLRKQHGLKEEYTEMLVLCGACRCLLWQGTTHPCLVSPRPASHHLLPVPPQAFLKFFSL